MCKQHIKGGGLFCVVPDTDQQWHMEESYGRMRRDESMYMYMWGGAGSYMIAFVLI